MVVVGFVCLFFDWGGGLLVFCPLFVFLLGFFLLFVLFYIPSTNL